MIHVGILEYRKARYLWVSLILIAISVGLYISQSGGLQPPNGGTWQGYTLGTISALLIVWLCFLGVRKRRYSSNMGTVAGWTSAHVYLGTTLLVLATLHSAAQIGWNVHTLAYVLMCVVILSGLIGIFAYQSMPRKTMQNRGGRTREELFAELRELDQAGATCAQRCSTGIAINVNSAIKGTIIGGGVFAQLGAGDRSTMEISTDGDRRKTVKNHDQQRILAVIADQIPQPQRQTEVEPLRELLTVMGRRQTLIRRLNRDIQLQARMRVWLYLHIPLSIALLIALIVHIISTFLYW